jgi:zinc protease
MRLKHIIRCSFMALSQSAFGSVTTNTYAQPAASQTTPIKPVRSFVVGENFQIETFTLPNGLTVILGKNPRAPLVEVHHWVRAGSLHEKPGITGIAHLFEHMMFRPLKKDAPGFFEIAQKLGVQANANTRFESTVYTSRVPLRNLEPLLEAEANRFQNLKVTDELLNIERGAVWSEYSTKLDSSPSWDLWFTQYRKAFPSHPFEWMITGFREDLEKIKASDCNSFFEKYYRPENVGLIITGNIDTAKTLSMIEKLYGKWVKGEESNLPSPFQGKPGLIKAEGKLPAQSKQVLAGWRMPYLNGQNALLASFVNHILFDSANNLATRRFVDRSKVASSISGHSFEYGHGMLSGYVSVLPGVTDEKLIAEFLALRSDFDSLSPRHIKAYAKEFQVATAEGLERNSGLVGSLAHAWGKYGDETLVQAWSTQAPSFSRKELRAYADAYFTRDNFVYVSTPQSAPVEKAK